MDDILTPPPSAKKSKMAAPPALLPPPPVDADFHSPIATYQSRRRVVGHVQD